MPQNYSFGETESSEIPSTADLFDNMDWFLTSLDQLCSTIEKCLLKSFSQKLTEWALQPWNANKDRALAESTTDLRRALMEFNDGTKLTNKSIEQHHWAPVLNPMDSNELLLSILPEESYILPSAHFPLLLSFDACPRRMNLVENPTTVDFNVSGMSHRVRVNVVAIRCGDTSLDGTKEIKKFVVHAAVGGKVKESGRSMLEPYFGSSTHRWHDNNILEFESRLPNHPGTVEVRVSTVSFEQNGKESTASEGLNYQHEEIGFSFVDISKEWKDNEVLMKTYHTSVLDYNKQADFDSTGILPGNLILAEQQLSLELEITTESIPLFKGGFNTSVTGLNKKAMLLYKHDEDMRQEMLAIQFVRMSDDILKASGLDLKIKTYGCISVGDRKGFIEWIPGTLSLSELCKPIGNSRKTLANESDSSTDVNVSNHGESRAAFVRTGRWCKYESIRAIRQNPSSSINHHIGLSGNNPIQEFLRSNAYEEDAPYLIREAVMDNFVKSCAGYCVITYLLGVGDRHTDNLLLHPEGYFLHCDYSFILGQDPKTYLPMRITERMVNAMGGRESDNFSKFLSLAGAAFIALRRPSAVRILMSLVKGVIHTNIPDVSINQSPEDALKLMYKRFCLDLDDDDAVAFLEENIERSITSKIWIAVDTIHRIGKHF